MSKKITSKRRSLSRDEGLGWAHDGAGREKDRDA